MFSNYYENIKELKIHEKYFINVYNKKNNCHILNVLTPILTKEEYKEYKWKKDERYRKKHHDKLNEKIECNICKRQYTYKNKSIHFKTKIHQYFINNTITINFNF